MCVCVAVGCTHESLGPAQLVDVVMALLSIDGIELQGAGKGELNSDINVGKGIIAAVNPSLKSLGHGQS